MSDGKCEQCGGDAGDLKLCRKCDGKKFVSAAKSLFGHLAQDARNVVAKFKKVRVKSD